MEFNFYKAPAEDIKTYDKTELKDSDWRDGIIIRTPNWLGDIVMTLPSLYYLKQLLPNHCGFFVATPASYVTLFKSIPWIDAVVPIGTGHSSWTKEQLSNVKKLHAGVGVLFVNSLRSAYYFKKAGIHKIFGASNGLRNFILTKHYEIDWHTKKKYGSTHQAYKYLAMVNALGKTNFIEKFPEFILLPEADIKFPEIKSLKEFNNILVVHPGAAYGASKRWPAKYFREVCNNWIQSRGGKVVVLGLANESATANEVINGLPPDSIFNLVGKTSLAELMYVLKMADLCLCNDSGTMHLAAALNVNGIAFFGSTDPFTTGPLGGKWIVLMKQQDCSPCFSRECINSEKDYKCLTSITPDSVSKAIEQLLN